MTVKKWYSASELAGLPGMPGTVQGTLKRAKAKRFASRPASGKKGSEFSFSDLPEETKNHLRPITRHPPRKDPAGKMPSLCTTSINTAYIPLSRVHKIMPIVNNLLYLLMDLKRELRAGQ